MSEVVEKVTAFIVRENRGVKELLVFKHPTAGTQIPAGTVERGETIEAAVKRETHEETGLQLVEIQEYLGCIENELAETERVISETTEVYIEPHSNAMPYAQKLTRGLTVHCHAKQDRFTHISYIEYDRHPNPTCIRVNITGWVPNKNLSAKRKDTFSY